MRTKNLLLTPKEDPQTYEGVLLGGTIVKRFREILQSGEATFTDEGIKVMKRELVVTVRKETGNMMCLTDVSSVIDEAVSEYVDGFIQNLKYKDIDYCTYLLSRLVRRVENEVMHFKN